MTIWPIAAKDMTSLAEIELMRDRCRVTAKEPAGMMAPPGPDPADISLIAIGMTSQDAFRMKLLKRKESS